MEMEQSNAARLLERNGPTGGDHAKNRKDYRNQVDSAMQDGAKRRHCKTCVAVAF